MPRMSSSCFVSPYSCHLRSLIKLLTMYFFFSRFKKNLSICLLQITGYKNLYECAEELRKEVFDCEKEEHENMVLKVILLLLHSVKYENNAAAIFQDLKYPFRDSLVWRCHHNKVVMSS